ncbi:MAG: T9SS sorting signal type C domain-containing protein [Flavobacterium sp. JAD_PAG50586_2]|nr:MAG: T9SS sorting signal type C domain-containing protein [Flavobacterium sp. JAD_PAG50586_2]
MKISTIKNSLKLILFIFILCSAKAIGQCPTPPEDQNSYGSSSWIGYVYNAVNNSNPPTNVFSTTYRGYITQSEIFDLDLGTGAISGANLCGTYSDQFSVRFRMMKNFPAGNYSFIVGGDDGYRLSFDGGATFPVTNWTDHGYATTTTTSVYLNGNTNLVLEYYEQGGSSRVSFSYANCANPSTAPTGISGTNSICSGSSTTLTAIGGTLATGAIYQWGTGTVGNNIITGQTGVSITVSPTSSTTYWVRRVDSAPCNANTNGVTQPVTVNTASTAPTSITGTTTICLGNSTTLTASGGTQGSNGIYEWGTGYTAGINVISGATASTLTVSPTATTGYWVRRVDPTPCSNSTAIISTTVNVNTPSGDQVSYGNNTWIGYVYSGLNTSNPPSNIATAPYRGYITQPEIFDQNLDAAALSGGNLCGTYADQFFIRYKMTKNFTAGYYTFTVGGDDGCRLSLDGGSTYIINSFVDHSYATYTSATIYLSGNVNLVLEYYEQATNSRVLFNYTSCTNFSTVPTGITGNTNLCYGQGGTTLTATGGNAAPGSTYQWGTGSVVGTNPIAGATYNGYYINPATTTTYWVRRVDGSPCNQSSGGYVFTVNVATQSTQPGTITPNNTTVCSGSSLTLTASGGTLGSNGVYEWGTGYNAGVNTILGQSGASITINPTSTSGYWVRRVDSAPCSTATGHITTTITVNNASTAPTSISGAGSASCSGSGYTLTASGGTAATGSTYQWGTGSIVGTNPIAGNGISITVSPTATTTYWVRRYDASCTSYTGGVTTTVTITAPPGNPATAGNNVWNLYGYSTADISLTSAVYAGYYSVSTLNFDTQNGTNSWNSAASPSSSAGWSGCTVPVDNFTMVAKRKGFPCGTYTIAMQNWDDSAQLYLNGTMIWSNNNWSGDGNFNVAVGSYTLDSNSEIEVRVRENTGVSNVSLTLTNTNVVSTTPTAISGTASVCNGSSVTLTATGGTLGTTGSYEWGTGNVVGTNPISGQTAASIIVSPSSDTTYWVRRKDSVCGNTTSGVSQLVNVTAATVAGSLSTTTTTICRNTAPNAITLSGNTGNVIKWQYANDSAFTSGVTNIASTATVLSSTTIGNLTATRYYRAVVQNANCSVVNTPSIGIIVPTAITYSNGSRNGTPTNTTPVIISSNLTLSSNLNVCSCQITNTAVVTVPSNLSLIVQNDLSVASTASLVIENNGSLVQVSNTASDVGNITFKRNSAPLKQYDYTYWSSPLAGQTLNQLGTPSLFYAFDPNINNWAAATSATVMDVSKGYISRVPNNLNFATPQVLNITFTGVPNNGIISTPIIKSTGTFNLIGNPYPSAIDIDAFLLDPTNSGVVNGTIYLWTHNTGIANTVGTGMYNYTRDDYAKYNITGGVKTASSAITGGSEPTGKVAAGQGFFIEANTALAAGTYSAIFNNSMRVANNNNQFFKINPANGNEEPVSGVVSALQKNRVWLNITNATGAYDEALVGYITGATNDFDNLYDGKTFPAGNVVSLYSILDTANYAIQGRALPFNENDIVPLGITTTISGDFSISLEHFDGLFQNQNVFLLDKSTGIYHDLKTAPFDFNIATGTYNDRFELRFDNGTLGTDNPISLEDDIKIVKTGKHIEVTANNFTIDKIQFFDLLGKSLYFEKDINSNQFKTAELNIAKQVIIVKITLDNGNIITKKILF